MAIAVILLTGAAAFGACAYVFADGFESGERCEWEGGCASVPFEVREAVALSATEVMVCFNHSIDQVTLGTSGEQFLFSGSLLATGAEAAGTTVTVDTTLQGEGLPYVVTVASSLADIFGNPVSGAVNSAEFQGFAP